nr:GH92 family glycosyl hydrolase [Prevotella sp. 10(H)]
MYSKINILILLLLVSSFCYPQKKYLTDYVNPFIGTALKGEGGTAPFVCSPFAMTNFLPQTRENKMGTMAYVYDDSHMIGFLASHQPTVWMGDYGYVSLMPQIGELKVLPEKRGLKLDKKNEQASPYYYSALMETDDKRIIQGEIAASSRCALFRFTFPKSEESHIIIQGINLNPELKDWCNDYEDRINKLKGWIKIDVEKNEIIGYNPDRQSAQLGPELPNFKGYFIIQFDKPIEKYGTWEKSEIFSGKNEQSGTRMGAYISFSTKNKEKITARIATSFISIDQARRNLEIEVPEWSFDKLKQSTKQKWEEKLSKLQVSCDNENDKSIFYTALYHCYLFPREFSEYGKYYSAFDDKIHEGVSHNDYSLWDTFRAFHPLMTLLEPSLTNDWITSLLQMYKEGGWLPIWPNPTYTNIMIGTHADAFIADAYMKGIRNYDVSLAYEAMRKNAMTPPDCDTQRRYGDRDRWTSFEARAGASYYHTIGYVPDDKTAESTSRTLEYAYDDWCIAQVAKDMGKRDDYEQLMRWSGNYKNVYKKDKGFMLPRKYNGEWIDTDDNTHHGMTEGSKWTYLFCVMQDIPGMIDMMGGNKAFAEKLDRNFNENHYRHDNEPGHHYVYLYNYCGQPWKTQELVRHHTRINYRNSPDGVNGNDDCGQMSAWYLFSVMGFYPVTPGSNEFAIGAPQFPEIRMKLQIDGEEKILTIKANNLSEENKYVKGVYIDNKKIEKSFINYFDLIKAKQVTFEMGNEKSSSFID